MRTGAGDPVLSSLWTWLQLKQKFVSNSFRIFQTHPSLSLSNNVLFLSVEGFNIGAFDWKFWKSALWRGLGRWGAISSLCFFFFCFSFVNFAWDLVKVKALMVLRFWVLLDCLERPLSVYRLFLSFIGILLRWLLFQFMLCLRHLMMFFCRFRVVLTYFRAFLIAMLSTLPCRLDKLLSMFWRINFQ